MADDLPLPNVIPDVGPGGPLVTAMRGMNALSSDMLDNHIKSIQAKYAPLTALADASSKMTYSNLMGPQFLAKLMANEPALANMSEEQKRSALNMLYNAGSGQQGANPMMQMLAAQGNQQANNPLVNIARRMSGGLSNIFGQQSPQGNPQIDMSNVSPQDLEAIKRMQQGDSYVVQGNQAQQPAQQQISKKYPQFPIQPGEQPTFAENTGAFKGTVAEGAEAGKIRAQDIKELGDIVFSGQTKQSTMDNIAKIISSPEFEQIRQTPILGHNELSYYQRYGSKGQQNMVGQLMTLSGNIIKDSARDFAGQFRKGEQQLLENMKINPGDTVDAARGKMEQLSYLNKILTERSRLTAQYMSQYHISKLEASEIADKQINGDAIRDQMHNQLNPKPTDDDIEFMAKKYNISNDEVRKRLKAKGIG